MAYNGWKNYETWNVALWIDNDQGSYSQRQEMAQDAWDNTDASEDQETRSNEARNALADSLESWVDEMNPINESSMFADLLSAALREVDWHEIAENFLEDVDKETADTEETIEA